MSAMKLMMMMMMIDDDDDDDDDDEMSTAEVCNTAHSCSDNPSDNHH